MPGPQSKEKQNRSQKGDEIKKIFKTFWNLFKILQLKFFKSKAQAIEKFT